MKIAQNIKNNSNNSMINLCSWNSPILIKVQLILSSSFSSFPGGGVLGIEPRGLCMLKSALCSTRATAPALTNTPLQYSTTTLTSMSLLPPARNKSGLAF